MISGIYLLRFSKDLVYIGQSKDIFRRYSAHCNKLTKSTHVNSKMQSAYNEYGIPSLEILIECPPPELDVNEIEAIEIYDSIASGLNIAPAAGFFPEAIGELNSNSKYSNERIIHIAEYLADNLNQPLKISAKLLYVHYSTVKNISNGTSHKWLAEKIPEKYRILTSYKGKRSINTSEAKGIEYAVISPQGEIYKVTNISNFAKEHGLNAGALGQVLRGRTYQHKGWISAY